MFNPDQVAPIKSNAKSNSDSSIEQTRPQGSPKSNKDFKKMIRDVDPDSRGSEEEIASLDEEEESAYSVFDLLAKKKTEKKEFSAFKSSLVVGDRPSQAVDQLTNNEAGTEEEGDFDSLFASLQGEGKTATSGKEKIPQFTPSSADEQSTYAIEQTDSHALTNLTQNDSSKDPAILADASKEARLASIRQSKSDLSPLEMVGISKEEKSKKAKIEGRFVQENIDLSYVNPVQSRSSNDIQADANLVESPSTRFDALKEIIDRITDGIQTITHNGSTETVVKLKYPPILDGSQINLTSFDSAKGEFNIAFTNLTGPAKEFLDRQLAGQALTTALERKGFVVHMVTTSTLQDIPLIQVEGEQLAGQDRRGQQEQQQRHQQRQDEEET